MLKIFQKKITTLLDWTGRILKIDAHYLAHGGFWLTSRQIVASLSSFFLSIAFANWLPKETFGTYKYLLSAMALLAITSLGGINTAFTQSVARGMEGNFRESIGLRIRWSFWGSLIAIGFSIFYYFLQRDSTLALGFLLIAFFLPFLEPLGIFNALFLGRRDFKKAAQFNALEIIANFCGLFLMLLTFPNVLSLLVAYIFSYIIIRFFVLKITLKKYPPNDKKDIEMFRYGRHLTAISTINEIAKYFDKILIFNYFGAIDLAIYTIAISPINQISNLINPLGQIIFPKYAVADKKKTQKTLIKKTVLLGAVALSISLIYIIIAPFIFRWLFPKFPEAVFYSQIFALSLVSVAVIIPTTFLQAQKEIKKMYWLNTLSPILSIVILFIAIPFGLLGIIIARFIFRIINLILFSIVARFR